MMSFCAEHHRRRDLGVEHQVAAVADHHDDFAVGPRHLDAEAAGDLVAHARVAVFHVIAAGHRRAPELVQLAPAARPPRRRRCRSRLRPSAAPRRSRRRRTAAPRRAAGRRAMSARQRLRRAARAAPARRLRRRQSPQRLRQRFEPARASPTSGAPRHLSASNALTLRSTSSRLRGTANASRW